MKEKNGEIVMKQTDKSGKSGAGIWIILIFVCLILLVLSVFWLQNSRVYKLNLPKQENISQIVFKDTEKESIVEEKEKEKVFQILLGEARSTREESVQDYPVNAEEIMQIDFVFKEAGTSTIFIYRKGNKFYIEQPYNGIYEITKEEYWLLQSQLAPIESFVSEEKEQAGIRIDGRDYYMYAVVSKSQTGEQIGIVDGDSDHQIYELKGYDPEKWIVEFLHSGLMDNYVLMKEEDVTETIEGIEQEFE